MKIAELLQDSIILDLEEDLDVCLDNEEDGSELVWESASLLKRRRALKKAPAAPKRFKSAYICYVMDKMEESKQSADPNVKVTELMKKLATTWKNLLDEKRYKYEIIAEVDKARYFKELSAYSGPMQVPNTRKKKNPCAPKRAMSAFLSYSKEMRPRIRAEFFGMKNVDVSVVLAQRWRAAAENEKKPHLDKERQDRQKYYENMAVWKVSEEERVKDEEVAIDFTNLPSQLHWGAGSGGGNSRGGSVSDGITGGDQSGSECDAISNSGEGSEVPLFQFYDADDAQKATKKRKYAQSSSHTRPAAASSEIGFEEGAAAVFSAGSSSSGSTAGFWSGQSSGRTLRTDCALDSSCSSCSCAGLSDNVHEGLSAYVTFMDEDRRKHLSSKSHSFLFGGLPLPSAHQTARWLPDPLASAQAHAQAQLLAKHQQYLGAGSNSGGAAAPNFWDFMMTQPWSGDMRNMGGAAAYEAPTLYNQHGSYHHDSQQESSQFGTTHYQQYQQYQQNDDTASLSSLSTPSGTGCFVSLNTVLPPGWS